MSYTIRKLAEKRVWRRILLERLTEPLHLNIASLAVGAAGSLRTRIEFDLVVRQQHAFGLLAAADLAKEVGVSRVTAIEFGVASGAGLMNLCEISRKIEKITGIGFDIVGFDSGQGLPAPGDWRDHPELYSQGDFPLQDREALLSRLPANARVIFGPVGDTVPDFIRSAPSPIGFASFDLDYYCSTVDALGLFQGQPAQYLPRVTCYFDDVWSSWHNRFAGELLAIHEFNQKSALRKITPYNFLRNERIFKNARWIDCMYLAHVFDHPYRDHTSKPATSRVLGNPYLV